MKLKSILITAAITAAMTASAFAQDISVSLNGSIVDFPNQGPVISEGRTLIPLRGVFDKLGYTIQWDGDVKTAYLTKGDDTISITIGEAEYRLNGESCSLDVPAQIINGSTMIPMRAVAEATGASVLWDNDTKIATILSPDNVDTTPISGTVYVNTQSEQDYINSYTNIISDYNDVVLKYYNCIAANTDAGFGDEELMSQLYSASKDLLEVCTSTKSRISSLNCPSKFNELNTVTIEYMDAVYSVADIYVAAMDGEIPMDELNERLNTIGTQAALKENEYKEVCSRLIK